MKIPIIFVVPGDCATKHSARKLSRNCREYGMILRAVGCVCAGAVSPAAYYWLFDKLEYLFNKIIPVGATSPPRSESSVPCFRELNSFSMTATPSLRFIDSRPRVYVFFRMWFINARTMRRPPWCFVSISVTYSRSGGFKSDRNRQSVRGS